MKQAVDRGKRAWNGMEDLNLARGPRTYRGLSHLRDSPPGLSEISGICERPGVRFSGGKG